ncbi:hypothetical protein [Dulcicalothrix desertica]|uniref:hypothetical protein n=1 Tax=Dulcicalothrix desertica TaxID=32056 RepID=UPI0013152480|nr:hypothetical protein [Dulcicalothrix desertica]
MTTASRTPTCKALSVGLARWRFRWRRSQRHRLVEALQRASSACETDGWLRLGTMQMLHFLI